MDEVEKDLEINNKEIERRKKKLRNIEKENKPEVPLHLPRNSRNRSKPR